MQYLPIPVPPLTSTLQPCETHPAKRWAHKQKLVGIFWKRWSKEYLSSGQPRKKWTSKQQKFKVGDVALLVDENQPTLHQTKESSSQCWMNLVHSRLAAMLLATSNTMEWKMNWKLITAKKIDLHRQRFFQMLDSIYAGFFPFICNLILYRIIEIFTTAYKTYPRQEAAVGWASWLWIRQIETGSGAQWTNSTSKKIAIIAIQRFRGLVL